MDTKRDTRENVVMRPIITHIDTQTLSLVHMNTHTHTHTLIHTHMHTFTDSHTHTPACIAVISFPSSPTTSSGVCVVFIFDDLAGRRGKAGLASALDATAPFHLSRAALPGLWERE
jgi:hypothetical protein